MPETKELLEVKWIVDESEVKGIVDSIVAEGGKMSAPPSSWRIPADLIDDYSDVQFEPLMMIAASMAVGFLVKKVSDVILDHKRPGGCIIDMRMEPLMIRPGPHLERGTLVVVGKDGAEVLRTKDKNEIPAWILEKLGHA